MLGFCIKTTFRCTFYRLTLPPHAIITNIVFEGTNYQNYQHYIYYIYKIQFTQGGQSPVLGQLQSGGNTIHGVLDTLKEKE